MLRTTINMRYSVHFKVRLAAARLGKTRQEVVKILINRIVRDIDRYQGGFTLVKYQARDPLKRWKRFPISFRENENEFVKDLRRLSKFAVSYLVAIAAERYLEELLKAEGKKHNYAEFPDYAVGQRISYGIICWEFYWGNPGPSTKFFITSKIHRRTASL